MFRTLRGKLLTSYLIIIFICLILAGSLGLFWLQRYEREVALTRVRLTAQALSLTLRALPLLEARSPAALLRTLRDQYAGQVELLFFIDDQGTILPTGLPSHLVGQRVPLPPASLAAEGLDQIPWRRWRSHEGSRYYVLYLPLSRAAESVALPWLPPGARFVALAAPAEDIQRSWRGWLPQMLLIGLVALGVAAVVSLLLFRSVTRPLAAMTRAAEEMALGNYQQEIPVQSQDEIGRLAVAFNRMAYEVERAQRTQRELLVNISHDLQTPLTSIRGFSQALVEGRIQDEERLYRAESIIYEEANRMGHLIQGLLDLARLEAGQIEMARAPVDLAHLLTSTVDKFASQAQEAGIDLELDVPAQLPIVRGDAERLEQVFTNLLDNAFKYTPAGGQVLLRAQLHDGGPPARNGSHANASVALPTLSLQLPLLLAHGYWIAVTVSDTGPGIQPEDLYRIFERFYRVDKARSGTEGVGLGLTIAREIVMAHGGYITADSQPGKGSQFYVLLPAEDGKAR